MPRKSRGKRLEIRVCRAMAIFLAGTKLSRIGIDIDRSTSKHGGRAGEGLGLDDLEVLGRQAHRDPRARAPDGVVHGLGQVEVERVAVLVGLGRLLAVVARPRPGRLVVPQAVLGHLGEQVAQGLVPQTAHPLGGELGPPALVLDQAGLGQLPGQPGQPVERAGGVLAQVAGHLVEVDLAQGGRRGGRLEHVLHPVEFAQLGGQVGGLGQAHRRVAAEAVALAPPGPGEGPRQVAAQPLDLPAQVHVLEQRLGQRAQLVALFGRERAATWPRPPPCGRPAARAARRGSPHPGNMSPKRSMKSSKDGSSGSPASRCSIIVFSASKASRMRWSSARGRAS